MFVEALDEQLDTILLDEQDVEAAWITLQDTIYSTAMEYLRLSTRTHGDRFDENHAEIMDLIGKRHAAHLAHLHDSQSTTKKDSLRSIHRNGQLKLCEMQDFWLNARVDEIQGYTGKNDMKNSYSSLREVYGPTSACLSLLLSADETKFKSEEQDPWRGGLSISVVY